MRVAPARAENVLDGNPSRDERVRQQGTVASPGHCFRAHDRAPLFAAHLQKPLHGLVELLRLHVIRVTAKARVAPAEIRGIRAWVPQAAQFLQVRVLDVLVSQGVGQRVAIELRIMPRTRNRADIDQPLHAVPPQQFDELLDRARRMADGQNERRLRFPFRAQLTHLNQVTVPNKLKSRITSTISVSTT